MWNRACCVKVLLVFDKRWWRNRWDRGKSGVHHGHLIHGTNWGEVTEGDDEDEDEDKDDKEEDNEEEGGD